MELFLLNFIIFLNAKSNCPLRNQKVVDMMMLLKHGHSICTTSAGNHIDFLLNCSIYLPKELSLEWSLDLHLKLVSQRNLFMW